MQTSDRAKKGPGGFSLALVLIMLVNPTVKLVDVLPDFIACAVIASRLTAYADRAPYFAEAREAFIKLAWLNALRIPAFGIAALIKSGNVADNDITVLFTFVFAFFEAYLLILAVKYLFSAIFYVGMRSDSDKALAPFALMGGKKRLRPEALRFLIYIFIIFRAAATALPEMLLLTRSDEIGVNTNLFNFRALYPYFTVILVPAVLIFGIILARMIYRYVSGFSAGGEFFASVDALTDSGTKPEIEAKVSARRKKYIVNLFILGAALAVDIRFSNLSMIDIVPNFLTGLVIFFAVFKISKETKHELLSLISLGVYTIISAVSHITCSGFLDTYGYEALASDSAARSEYIAVINIGFLEFLALAVSFILLSHTLILFSKRHMGSGLGNNEKSVSAAHYQRKIKVKIFVFTLLAIVNGLMKFLYTLFAYYSSSTLVATESGFGTVVSGLVPWFGSAVFASWLLFVGYSIYFFGFVKEEIDHKLQ